MARKKKKQTVYLCTLGDGDTYKVEARDFVEAIEKAEKTALERATFLTSIELFL